MKWGLISRNPAALTAVTKLRKRKLRFYDESQARVFLEAICGDSLEVLFWLALCLGSRKGEVLGLQWTDFDFEREAVTIVRSLQRIRPEEKKKSNLELIPTKVESSDRRVWLP